LVIDADADDSSDWRSDGVQSKPAGKLAPRAEAARVAAELEMQRQLRNRQTGQRNHVLPIAWRAQHCLHRVHHRMRERGKPHNLTSVAVARELAGFLWAAATAPSPCPPTTADGISDYRARPPNAGTRDWTMPH
jgi:hypothetical protein